MGEVQPHELQTSRELDPALDSGGEIAVRVDQDETATEREESPAHRFQERRLSASRGPEDQAVLSEVVPDERARDHRAVRSPVLRERRSGPGALQHGVEEAVAGEEEVPRPGPIAGLPGVVAEVEDCVGVHRRAA